MNPSSVFDDLFVLELANNHWGDVNRGLKIINDYSKVVRFNNVRAAIKLQFRDVDNFIHPDYRGRTDIRYISKTLATKLTDQQFQTLVTAIRQNGCLTMATPFDERSVDLCVELNLDLVKIASSDINDWVLLQKIATAGKPVIASTGGASLKDMDDLVKFFEEKHLPLAINHCVSLYPSEDHELDLNQITFLKNRYPNHVIGFSTHEYHDWQSSLMIAYSKGARTFERHVDINSDGRSVSPYCSLPHQVDLWFKAFHQVRQMCGGDCQIKRIPPKKEIDYLDQLVRGAYAKSDLPVGHVITADDIFWAVPLLKGQLSCRENLVGETVIKATTKGQPLFVDSIDSPYAYNENLKNSLYQRGIDPTPPPTS